MNTAPTLDIFLVVVLGSTAMAILTGFIIFFVVLYQKKSIIQKNEMEAIKTAHQKELLQKTIEVEEQERESIAKNIHDDLGALISILRLNNSRVSKNIDNNNILTEIFEANKIILNKTSESVRTISKKLASPTLIKLGYVKALKELCSSINQSEEIKVSFNDVFNKPLEITTQNASHLFRASQEIINNILKHSGASQINVSLTSILTTFTICFEHNGLGVTDESVKELITLGKGLGLTSIKSRLNIIKADIHYTSLEEKNPAITITYYEHET